MSDDTRPDPLGKIDESIGQLRTLVTTEVAKQKKQQDTRIRRSLGLSIIGLLVVVVLAVTLVVVSMQHSDELHAQKVQACQEHNESIVHDHQSFDQLFADLDRFPGIDAKGIAQVAILRTTFDTDYVRRNPLKRCPK